MDPVPGAPCGFTLLSIVESGQAQRLRRSTVRSPERDTCGRPRLGRFSSSIRSRRESPPVKPFVSAEVPSVPGHRLRRN